MSKLVTITFSLLVIASLVFGQLTVTCPAGQYYLRPIRGEIDCYDCERGNFCPGDDHFYPCSDNTIAPYHAMSKCIQCPDNSPRAWKTHTFCVPPDTPKNAKDFTAFGNNLINSFKDNYVAEVHFNRNVKFLAILLQGQNDTALLAYASTSGTGNPSLINHQFSSKGHSVTLIIPRPNGSDIDREAYQPLFLTLVSNTPDLVLPTKVQDVLLDPIVLSAPEVQFRVPYTMQETSYIFFSVPNVAPRSIVNVTMTTTNQNESNQFTLYASNERSFRYPNEFNYDFKKSASASPRQTVSSSVQIQSDGGGTVFLSVSESGYYTTLYKVNLTITKF